MDPIGGLPSQNAGSTTLTPGGRAATEHADGSPRSCFRDEVDRSMAIRPLRCLLIFGTRPEAIKMAPVVRECARRHEEVEAIVCLNGQHREMLRQVTDHCGIREDEYL